MYIDKVEGREEGSYASIDSGKYMYIHIPPDLSVGVVPGLERGVLTLVALPFPLPLPLPLTEGVPLGDVTEP